MNTTVQEIESVETCFFNATGFMFHPRGDTLYIRAILTSQDNEKGEYTRSEVMLYSMTSKVMTIGASEVAHLHLARTILGLLNEWFRDNIS